nr:coiled-coil domain-containing protein 78-like [Chelonoidis abingdonii]
MDLRSAMESENISTLQEQVQCLTNENVQLQDRNERLYTKLGELQEKMGKLVGSKTDLSSRLVFSEEEKLKISKDLIDLQMETNKMREQYEAENFELKNMILTLENRILELELHDEKVTGEHDALQERLHTVETNRKELADEYIILKSNYMALGKEHEQEVAKNEELSIELLNLVNTRSSLPQSWSNYSPSQALANETSAELERVRAVVHRLSARKVKPEDIVASEHERRKLERHLLGNQDHLKAEIEKMKQTYDSQQQKLEQRVEAMGKELQQSKRVIRNTQHKLVEQSVVLLTSQSQLKEVEVENSQLQLQLKELNEEYRCRLTQYIKDLAEYMDSKSNASKGPNTVPADHAYMKRFVDGMLKDIRAAHKSREEQLAGAVRSYKKRMQNLVKRHENLLIAYRDKREFRALADEGAVGAKATLQAASDMVDTAARLISSAISMCRALGLSAESQSLMQELPFDGKDLFADQTDICLHGMKDSCTTLQNLGLYVPPAKDKPRPQTLAPPARGRCEPLPKRPREQRHRSQRQSRSAL